MIDFQTRHNREVDVYRTDAINNVLILGNLYEYRINDISLQLDSLDYISVADCIGLSSTTLI